MKTTEELRAALHGGTDFGTPVVTLDAVRARARRYRRAKALAMTTVTTVVLTVGAVLLTFASWGVHPSWRASGQMIGTGVQVYTDRELALFFVRSTGGTGPAVNPSDWTLDAGLVNPETLAVRSVNSVGYGAPPVNRANGRGFRELHQLVAGDGRLIDYGWYVGPAARIAVTTAGVRTEARTTKWQKNPNIVVFWVERTGTSDLNQTVFTAYSPDGRLLGTSAGAS